MAVLEIQDKLIKDYMAKPKEKKLKLDKDDKPLRKYAPDQTEVLNDKLIHDVHNQKTEEHNAYWKKFWKDKYKNKSFKRALKSMSKTEKYKYLAYPNYNQLAASTAGPLGLPGLAGLHGLANYGGLGGLGPMSSLIPPVIPPLTAQGPFLPHQGVGGSVIDPLTGLPQPINFNPGYPYPYPYMHPYAYIPPAHYPYTINMDGTVDNKRYGAFVHPWDDPPYEPFKYYGGHDDEAELDIIDDGRSVDLTRYLAPLTKSLEDQKTYKYPIQYDNN
ncbi:UNKNOWN [Stylonychia lemnae]|uniref:Uncharacterized protein n=1 Tax=Stylonychia lemnae TaxID=5949 RepID=A0A078BA07_STYLE|nr:UNKNOWN [Stylonychia lemnae]|eukprot:CDW91254.1 UNKNOWN [Stylonychia lemnae]